MLKKLSIYGLALNFLLSSCSGDDDDDMSGEDCFTPFTTAEIEDNSQIVDDYNQSIHELIACGNLTVALCQATVTFINQVILGTADGDTPDGVIFQEGGTYLFTAGTGVSMSIVFRNRVSNSIGEEGEIIEHNLFDDENYLVGVGADISLTEIEITFEEAGPLVELLGFGPDPESPITIPLTLDGLGDIEPATEDMLVDSQILVDDIQGSSVITYEVDLMPGTTFNEVLEADFDYEVADAEGVRSDLVQNLTNTSWDLNFSQESANSGALTGTVAFNVTGGLFDYIGTLTWEDSGFGEEVITCP